MTGSGVGAAGIGVGADGSDVGAGVGSIVFGSVPCISVSSTLEVDAYELSCFACGEMV